MPSQPHLLLQLLIPSLVQALQGIWGMQESVAIFMTGLAQLCTVHLQQGKPNYRTEINALKHKLQKNVET